VCPFGEIIMMVLYIVGLSLSTFVGLWHFTVPYLYQWYSYIPDDYKSIIVGIDWINFFFSLLLSGYSLLLLIMRKKVFGKNKEIFIMYEFMVFIWFCRVVITFVDPWPLEPVAWTSYGQQIASFIIFLLLLIPFIHLLKKYKLLRKD
jgi:hypothetical protein